jgi:hypothetical protein
MIIAVMGRNRPVLAYGGSGAKIRGSEMGPIMWILNLWALRLASGAATLALMGAAIALYVQAQAVRERLDVALNLARQDAASIWEGL